MTSTFFTSFTGYGKTGVRVLKIKRCNERYHSIKEIEVSIELKLEDKNDYLHGDNASVIPTDTQKNTIYALAKNNELNSIEEFGVTVCQHFLHNHKHVESVCVDIEEAPWKRINQGGQEHAHSFVMDSEVIRFCQVTHIRGEKPKVSGGLKGLKVLKTTQSGFKGFLKDQYTVLPEVDDRCFCTVVTCKYDYDNTDVDFNTVWQIVKSSILQEFAGPAHSGVYSASVQNTIYLTEVSILNQVPQIGYVEMVMPNAHYFNFNLAPFGIENNNEVLMPMDKPSGNIKAGLSRRQKSKL
ncbi:uricase [Exaiptasia diaphana]|uniref:Uricase n=1 Tax=Exaiptasia diaphana TaxID=2652724 RepID=A0A913WZA2_EXADI|nr:uricase [Exaiptasia diaphana]KXJ16611.1 Uricase [Exaiptasia diaphana]